MDFQEGRPMGYMKGEKAIHVQSTRCSTPPIAVLVVNTVPLLVAGLQT